MDQESITRGILSGLVDRYIKEIAEDPNRSIRKLVDIAERTSDGPTQKICYQMMQKMAGSQSSPYYEMIHHLVTHTDPRTIKQAGINLGHNAWTFGSGRIRRISRDNGLSIPWTILIDRSTHPDRIPFSDIKALVREGRRHEVYAWMLMVSGAMDEWDEYADLFQEHPDCIFGLCADPDAFNEKISEEAAAINNLMILLNTDVPDWQEGFSRLSQNRCLISAFRILRDTEQAQDILSGSWLEELVPFHPLMAFSLISDTLPRETAEKISRYMWETRLNQIYPILPADLISDFLIISRLVSHQEVLYRIEANGSVSEGKGFCFIKSSLNREELFKSPGESL